MSYSPMYEVWRVSDEAGLFEVLLDLGYSENYPLASHPWFFGIRVPMAKAEGNGMPAEEEAARLDLVESRIREATRPRDGIYIGRREGQRNRDLVFYFPARPRGLEERIRASIGMEILFISRADQEWEGYEQLLPGPKEWRSMEDLREIGELLDRDTNPRLTHDVIHRVETHLKKGADALVQFMEKLELEEVSVTGERPELIVTGIQRTPLDPEAILEVSYLLEKTAPKAKAEYLGWLAEPVGVGAMGDDEDDDDDDLDFGDDFDFGDDDDF